MDMGRSQPIVRSSERGPVHWVTLLLQTNDIMPRNKQIIGGANVPNGGAVVWVA